MPEFRVEFTRDAQSGKFRAALYYPPDATKATVRTRPIYPSEDQALLAVVKLFTDAKAGGRGYAAALGKPPAKKKTA
jgi:hypothetical protein